MFRLGLLSAYSAVAGWILEWVPRGEAEGSISISIEQVQIFFLVVKWFWVALAKDGYVMEPYAGRYSLNTILTVAFVRRTNSIEDPFV